MTLEKIMDKKQEITPKIEEVVKNMLGLRIQEVIEDISQRLTGLDFDVDPKHNYKVAKKRFKKKYTHFLLISTHGNITEAARISGLDRKQITRIVDEFKIDIESIRQTPYVFKEKKTQDYLKNIFKDTMSNYDILQSKINHLNYELTYSLTKDMIDYNLTYNDAKHLFDKQYFSALIKIYNNDKKQITKHANIAYQSVLRKIKEIED